MNRCGALLAVKSTASGGGDQMRSDLARSAPSPLFIALDELPGVVGAEVRVIPPGKLLRGLGENSVFRCRCAAGDGAAILLLLYGRPALSGVPPSEALLFFGVIVAATGFTGGEKKAVEVAAPGLRGEPVFLSG